MNRRIVVKQPEKKKTEPLLLKPIEIPYKKTSSAS
jgi:hypothetical protein